MEAYANLKTESVIDRSVAKGEYNMCLTLFKMECRTLSRVTFKRQKKANAALAMTETTAVAIAAAVAARATNGRPSRDIGIEKRKQTAAVAMNQTHTTRYRKSGRYEPDRDPGTATGSTCVSVLIKRLEIQVGTKLMFARIKLSV